MDFTQFKEKVQESNYFLKQMHQNPQRPEINYNFHAFANALYSALEYGNRLKDSGSFDKFARAFSSALEDYFSRKFEKSASKCLNIVIENRRADVHFRASNPRKHHVLTPKETISVFDQQLMEKSRAMLPPKYHESAVSVLLTTNDALSHYYLGADSMQNLFDQCQAALSLFESVISSVDSLTS